MKMNEFLSLMHFHHHILIIYFIHYYAGKITDLYIFLYYLYYFLFKIF